MEGEAPWPAAAALLERAGLPGARLHRLPGGANNRSFRVEAGSRRAFLKAYFQHPADPRDRLDAEYRFCRLLWECGVRCVPQPLACDPGEGLGLYEFVEGRHLAPGEVDADAVEQALAFYAAVNRHRGLPDAARLAFASEAPFSIAGHLQRVGRRIAALERIDPAGPVGADALRFAREELRLAWDAVAAAARNAGVPMDEQLPLGDRCLSPSDFGFHNALLADDGRLRFIDFEYAGWDDPAKLICDFFCQPAVPVPMEHFARFAESVAAPLWHPERCLQRTRLLLPVYRLKWCCILLNDFLPVGDERRRFAGAADAGRRAAQLAKAREMLARVETI